MKLRNISGADLTCPLVPGGQVEAGEVVDVPDDPDVHWPQSHWEPVKDKPAKAAAKGEE